VDTEQQIPENTARVDRQMNSRVVQVGGWDSFQAIEPHLNAPTPEVVNDAFEDAGIA
jgi:hypothetical protein